MNLALMEPYELDYPESNPLELDVGFATCCTFSHDGSLLLVGIYDGTIIAYDIDSRTVVMRYIGLTKPVISISLTRNNKHMLATSSDGLIHRYHVYSGTVERVSSCPFALKWSQIHPLNPDLCIVSPTKATCYLVNLAEDTSLDKHKLSGIDQGQGRKSKSVDSMSTDKNATSTSAAGSIQAAHIAVTPDNWVPSSAWVPISTQRPLSTKSPVASIASVAQQLKSALEGKEETQTANTTHASIKREEQAIFGIFNNDGSRIYAGTARSLVIVYDTETVQELFRFTMSGGSHSTKHMCFSPDNTCLVVVSSALTAKLFPADPPIEAVPIAAEKWLAADVETRAQMGVSGIGLLAQYPTFGEMNDRVNRVAWRRAMFTRSGEYVVTITQDETLQTLYVWGCPTGRLVAVIRGPQVGTYDLAVHPTRPLVVSCADSGMLFIWTRPQREKWSAFSPDFEELNDNVEYFEREDEFDLKIWPAAAVQGAGFPDEQDQVRPLDVDTPHCAAWSPLFGLEGSEDDEKVGKSEESTTDSNVLDLHLAFDAERLSAAKRFKIAQPKLCPEVDPEIILAHERGMKLLRIRNAVVQLNQLAASSGASVNEFVENLVRTQQQEQHSSLEQIEEAINSMKRTKTDNIRME